VDGQGRQGDLRKGAKQHLVPHFTSARDWYGDDWAMVVAGDGCYVTDELGRRRLDGLSGLFCVNMGYGRDDLVEAAASQMKKLSFAPNWTEAHPSAVEASELLAGLAPGDLNRTFFVNSGSEAVEAAIKFARQYFKARGEPWRNRVVSRHLAYHGTTLGALSATALPKVKRPFEPLLEGFAHISNSKNIVGAQDQKLVAEHLTLLEEELENIDPTSVALLIAEPVQNSGGVLAPPVGYWSGLRHICDKYGILLLADEVITGFGRLGASFAIEELGAVPDMITFAKGATSGYVPLGGLMIRDVLLEDLYGAAPSFAHGSTFGAHPVATAVLIANVRAMLQEHIFDAVRRLEKVLETNLARLRQQHSCVGEVRGAGFLWALDLVADADSGLCFTSAQSQDVLHKILPEALEEAGVIARPDDRGGTLLVMAPPLVADEETLGQLCDRLDKVLTTVDSYAGSVVSVKGG